MRGFLNLLRVLVGVAAATLLWLLMILCMCRVETWAPNSPALVPFGFIGVFGSIGIVAAIMEGWD